VVAVAGDDLIALPKRHLCADDHRLLAHTICGKLLSGSAHLGRTRLFAEHQRLTDVGEPMPGQVDGESENDFYTG